jgi:hypothetical protein
MNPIILGGSTCCAAEPIQRGPDPPPGREAVAVHVASDGDREFESPFLQRGVRCEPDFRGRIPSMIVGVPTSGASFLTGDRGFESTSLHRRVSCEPNPSHGGPQAVVARHRSVEGRLHHLATIEIGLVNANDGDRSLGSPLMSVGDGRAKEHLVQFLLLRRVDHLGDLQPLGKKPYSPIDLA